MGSLSWIIWWAQCNPKKKDTGGSEKAELVLWGREQGGQGARVKDF